MSGSNSLKQAGMPTTSSTAQDPTQPALSTSRDGAACPSTWLDSRLLAFLILSGSVLVTASHSSWEVILKALICYL